MITTDSQFAEATKQAKVMVEFYATWCPDCSRIDPYFEAWKEKYGQEFTLLRVNRDEIPDTAERLEVMGIPSFIAFQDGQEVNRLYSRDAKSKAQVETFLDQAYAGK
jgi:thioredoxin-like negative regulator of GroEL